MRVASLFVAVLLLLPIGASAASAISQGGTATTSFSYGLIGSIGGLNYLRNFATSTLYGTGTGGQVLTWLNGVPTWSATSSIQNLSFTYPLQNILNVISLAFGTTTSNTWGGTQTFTNAPKLSSIANAAGSWLATNGSGTMIATTSPQPAGNYITALTGDVTASGPGSAAATIAANAVTYAKFQQVAGNSVVGNPTGATANAQAVATSSLGIALSDTTGTLAVSRGGTGQGTFTSSQLLYGNGTNAFSSVATSSETCSTGVSCTAHVVLTGGGAITLASINANSVLGNITGASAAPSTLATSSLYTWTGTGDVVRATSPTLITPNLGTPSALTLTNATGLLPTGINLTKGNFLVGDDNGLAQATTTIFNNEGKIGIGTITPAATLAVLAPANTTVPQFSVATSTYSSFVVSSDGRVGIGTSTPNATLHIIDLPYPDPHGITEDHYSDDTNNGSLTFRKSRGTINNWSSVLSGDFLGTINFYGYDGVSANWTNGSSADNSVRLRARTTQDWTSSAHGAALYFNVTPNDSVGAVLKMVLDSTGNLGLGTTTPGSVLSIAGTAGGTMPLFAISTSTAGFATSTAVRVDANGNVSISNGASLTLGTPLGLSSGGTATSTFYSGGIVFSDGTKLTQASNASSNSLWWDNTSGFLGVGTTSPKSVLEVSGSKVGTVLSTFTAAVTLGIENRSTTDGNFEALAFRTQDATNGSATSSSQIVGVNTSHTASAVSGALAFLTNSAGTLSEAMRIAAGGNVGIGTTTPGSTLTIKASAANSSGGIRVTGFTTPNDASYWSERQFAMQYGGTYMDVIDAAGASYFNGGNVGIGTSSPSQLLEVNGNSANTIGMAFTNQGSTPTSGTNPSLYLYSGGTSAFSISGWANAGIMESATTGGLVLDAYGGSAPIAFQINRVEKMRIASSGFVGIGTNAPTYALNVVGAGTTLSGTVSALLSVAQDHTNYRGSGLGYDSASGTGVVFADSAGGASNLSFWTYSGSAWGEKMRITGAGNVGIGTTTPQVTLHVVGPAFTASQETTYGEWVSNSTNSKKALALAYDTTNDSGVIQAVHQNVAWKNLVLEPNGGNVGIATSSPWRTYSLVGTMAINGLTAEVGTKSTLCIDPVTFEVESNAAATCTVSARRFKTNIQPLTIDALSTVMKLAPVSYNEKESGAAHLGFIAEDLIPLIPTAVDYSNGQVQSFEDKDVLAVMARAIQEMERQVQSILSRLDGQDAKIKALQAQNAHLQAEIDAINKKLK